MSHPIENIVSVTMERLRQLVDVNTVVGRPIAVNANTVILPVSRVTMGFLTGGGEYATKHPIQKSGLSLDGADYPFAGSSAAGISVTPTAFLTVQEGRVTVSSAHCDTALDHLVDLIPQVTADIESFLKGIGVCKKED